MNIDINKMYLAAKKLYKNVHVNIIIDGIRI